MLPIRVRRKPMEFADEGFEFLPDNCKVEEETLNYPPGHYYPVRLGELFKLRFQVVAKLGFGHRATVWLCRDLVDLGHFALKIYSASPHPPEQSREVVASRIINRTHGDHPGRERMRVVLDYFQIMGPRGRHLCLLYEPQGMSIREFRDHIPERMLTKNMLQCTLVYTLLALDYLGKAGVVHAHITPANILVGIADQQEVFERVETEELQNPSARKVLPDGTEIYVSRRFPLTFGPTVLCDFAHARYGRRMHTGDVMPDSYRAPEVILGMEWDSKVDIWSLGVMIWHLFEGGRLFYGEADRPMEDEELLAQMVSLMGPPPRHFLGRSRKCRQYWDRDGNWIGATRIPRQSFETREGRLSRQDKALFLTFIGKIFRWDPDERASPEQLLGHDAFLAQCNLIRNRQWESRRSPDNKRDSKA
ncbi:kinase-like domain-containing protein [Nemania sp. NC0429]|nr:kinase-like domain-containing protein [Nemania sp. NC0429]